MSCAHLSEGALQVVYPFGEMVPAQSELSQDLAYRYGTYILHVYIVTWQVQRRVPYLQQAWTRVWTRSTE